VKNLQTIFFVSFLVFVGRLLLSLLVSLCAVNWPETTMLQLLDLPTIKFYELAESAGLFWTVSPGFDLRFIAVSSLIWFTISFLLISLVFWIRQLLEK
jgi:hypothetical protein